MNSVLADLYKSQSPQPSAITWNIITTKASPDTGNATTAAATTKHFQEEATIWGKTTPVLLSQREASCSLPNNHFSNSNPKKLPIFSRQTGRGTIEESCNGFRPSSIRIPPLTPMIIQPLHLWPQHQQ